MNTLDAIDALHAAYDARDAAMTRAMQEVERQFSGIIKRRQQELQDAILRAKEQMYPIFFAPDTTGEG